MNTADVTRRESAREKSGRFGRQLHGAPDVTLTMPDKRPGRRRSGAVMLGVTALLASAVLTGCTPSGDVIDADYAKVCQEKKTEKRVEDDKCSEEGRSSGSTGWYFFPMGSSSSGKTHSVPAVGSKLSGGTTSIPDKATSKSGVSDKGSSKVTRGGFGGGAKGGSTGG